MDTPDDVKIATPTDREVVVTRTFDAPRSLVFAAYTQPELLMRWYGAPGRSLVVCEIDLRPGGECVHVVAPLVPSARTTGYP